ncbi:MAG: hypothetical protein ACREE0_21065 [Phenylobacterium sp.]
MEKMVGLLAALATIGAPLALGALPQSAQAQTRGMENRDDRRDTRQDSRSEKQACKAGDEKTRSECRQTKRDVKQDGRHNTPNSNSTTTNPH